MSRYEIMYLFSPKIKDEDLNPLVEQMRTLITKHKGKIVEELDMGKKKLAYPIKHFRHGFYYVIYHDMPTEKISALEKDLRLSDDVLRYLLVKHDERSYKALSEQKKRASEAELEKKAEGKDQDEPKEEKTETKPSVEEKPTAKDTKKRDDEKKARKAEDKKEKAKLDELDKKLDEILDEDIIE